VTRIDRAYDLLELFKNIGHNPTVQHSHYVLVSPFYHLLEGFPLNEEKNWFRMWENSIERLEKTLPIHVVVMGD